MSQQASLIVKADSKLLARLLEFSDRQNISLDRIFKEALHNYVKSFVKSEGTVSSEEN